MIEENFCLEQQKKKNYRETNNKYKEKILKKTVTMTTFFFKTTKGSLILNIITVQNLSKLRYATIFSGIFVKRLPFLKNVHSS